MLFLTRLQAFFADIPYELNDQTERHYQTVFLSDIQNSWDSSHKQKYAVQKGRADAVVKNTEVYFMYSNSN